MALPLRAWNAKPEAEQLTLRAAAAAHLAALDAAPSYAP
jgi:hypothetical protein